MIRRKTLCLICLFLIPLFLQGCYDSREIGELSYISILGVEEGEKEKYKFTFQIPKQSIGGQASSGGEDDEPTETITIEAPSFLNAINISNTYISKELNFMHLKEIVISEDLAKSGKMYEYIAPLIRYREIRRTTIVIICKGKAQEFVQMSEPYTSEIISRTIEEIMEKSEETGYFPKVTLNDFYDGLKAPYHALMVTYSAVSPDNKDEEEQDSKGDEKKEQSASEEDPKQKKGDEESEEKSINETEKKANNGDYYAGEIPRTSGEKIEHFGSALFDGDKMVGKLTGFETQMLLIARGQIKRAAFTINDPKEPEKFVSLEINEFNKPDVKVDLTDLNNPKIELKIKLEGSIMSIPSGVNYEASEEEKILEEALEKFIVAGIERTYKKCKDAKTDVFNFGTKAVEDFLTIPKWEEYNWLDKFTRSELKVEVDYTIRRTGDLIKTVPKFSTEGKE